MEDPANDKPVILANQAGREIDLGSRQLENPIVSISLNSEPDSNVKVNIER
jgi:hypothetical protein